MAQFTSATSSSGGFVPSIPPLNCKPVKLPLRQLQIYGRSPTSLTLNCLASTSTSRHLHTSVNSAWSFPRAYSIPQQPWIFIFGAVGLAGAVIQLLVRRRKQPACMPIVYPNTVPQIPTRVPRSWPPEKLPKWWPTESESPKNDLGPLKINLLANDSRMDNWIPNERHIFELRRQCKILSTRVTFQTDHTRDSFYQAAIDMVLDYCSRVTEPTATILICDQDARQFLCDFAHEIQLGNARALCLIPAAIAERMRTYFFQSWAFKVEGNMARAMEELSKIIQIYKVFPPAEDSPEIWILEDLIKDDLDLSQREHLLDAFKSISGVELHGIVARALGFSPTNMKTSSNTLKKAVQ